MRNQEPRRDREEALQKLYRFLIEAGISMGSIVGLTWPVHSTIATAEDDIPGRASGSRGENAAGPPVTALSRAEQRQWRRLVGQLQVSPGKETVRRDTGPDAGSGRPDRSLKDHPYRFE
jgi:hypothetical protein